MTENTFEIDANEPEIVDTEHVTIYYEHRRFHEIPLLSSLLPEAIYTENTHRTETENQPDKPNIPLPYHASEQHIPTNDDAASITLSDETPAPTTRNDTTRYSLREAPVHKTFDNFLVHELRAKPALLMVMQR